MKLNKLCCSILFYCLDSLFVDYLTVCTEGGWVRGSGITTRNGRKVINFNRIPYARPPVGSLRFNEPVPAAKWKGVKDVSGEAPPCVQYDGITPGRINITLGQEDCLYLSVTTPNPRAHKPMPVMVYFHGGGWFQSGSYESRGPEFLLDQDIVLVRVNYRLGPLGFLSAEDKILPGNFGLKDQWLALKWVQKNIEHFGGDPNRVTLFGESSGGCSVHLHMFSPRSQGLFQRAISSSGVGVSPVSVMRPGLARKRTGKLATILGCPSNDSREILDCLRAKQPYDIVAAHRKLYEMNRNPVAVLGPVVEPPTNTSFLDIHPKKLWTPKMPWMTGISSGDGLPWSSVLTSDEQDVYKKLEQGFDKIIPMALNLPENTTGSTNMTSRVKTFYFGKEPVTDQKFQQLTDVFTDSLFLHPAVDSLRLHLGVGFFYYFDYLGEWSHADRLHSRRAAKGPAHGDEAIYLFDDKRSFPALRGDDLIMSVKLVKLWTNFAKYGNPIPKNEIWDWGNWNDHRRYMHFGKDGFCLKRNLLSQRNEFWTNMTELYPNVLYGP